MELFGNLDFPTRFDGADEFIWKVRGILVTTVSGLNVPPTGTPATSPRTQLSGDTARIFGVDADLPGTGMGGSPSGYPTQSRARMSGTTSSWDGGGKWHESPTDFKIDHQVHLALLSSHGVEIENILAKSRTGRPLLNRTWTHVMLEPNSRPRHGSRVH